MNDLELGKDTFKVVDMVKAEVGRTYPPEFLSAMADDARELMRDRLKAKALKPELELFDNIIMMERYSIRAENPPEGLRDFEAADVVDVVANTTRLIAENGGKFYSAIGNTIAREVVTVSA